MQPLQPAPDARVLAAVSAGLRAFYSIEVRMLPAVPLPKPAYCRPRQRWRAEILLDWLAQRLPSDGAKTLGLTAADISTSKGAVHDWGVLGLGSVDGRSCVLSSFRAQKHATQQVVLERTAKIAVHEVGHTFGLQHCPTPGCLMADDRERPAAETEAT
ncbi:MAG: hypothetical protein EXR79_16760 [Myxococcales bacterium]|nr:hypothetical protein [Myxococcales bacterium]